MKYSRLKTSSSQRRLLAAVVGVGVLVSGLGLVWLLPADFDERNSETVLQPAVADTTGPGADRVENGIHVRTGFVDGEGLTEVIRHCTPCHSALLVTQNRMSREGWESTIRWMQETQNLWNLGADEPAILDYLAAYYAPEGKGRRANLEDIQWYSLQEQGNQPDRNISN